MNKFEKQMSLLGLAYLAVIGAFEYFRFQGYLVATVFLVPGFVPFAVAFMSYRMRNDPSQLEAQRRLAEMPQADLDRLDDSEFDFDDRVERDENEDPTL
jgi:hypothetical protein